MLRVLLTNDDGIGAPGIRQLAAQLAPHCEVVVIAPQNPQSATSHSITLHKPLRLNRVEAFAGSTGLKSIEAFECSGSPSDCVALGIHHVLADRVPHLVLSGINDGRNVAQDLTYSGTVGAALEGAVCGVPSIALSLDIHNGADYATAAQISDMLVSLLLFGGLHSWHRAALAAMGQDKDSVIGLWRIPEEVITGEHYGEPAPWAELPGGRCPCINVNIPNIGLSALRGICWTTGGSRQYLDVITKTLDPRGRPYYWIGGNRRNEDPQEGTDIWALRSGYVSVSPLTYDITSSDDTAALRYNYLER